MDTAQNIIIVILVILNLVCLVKIGQYELMLRRVLEGMTAIIYTIANREAQRE